MSQAFDVIWSPSAVAELASVWANAVDRSAVNLSVTGIDEALSRQPERKGSEVSEGLRKLTIGALCVYFEVEAPSSRVNVL